MVAFGGSDAFNSCMTWRGWITSPSVTGIAGVTCEGTATGVDGCGAGPLPKDSTNVRLDAVIPMDVATNRPNAAASGSTWTTSAFNPPQRGENERVTKPSKETPTAINRSLGVSNR